VTKRLNLVLICLLGIQILIILIFDKPWTSGYRRPQPQSEEEALLYPLFSAEGAAVFTVTQGEQKITLKRVSPDEWVIDEPNKQYKADIQWVEVLLDSLARAKKSDVVSEKASNWSHYEVGEEKGFHLQVWDQDGQKIIDSVIGKNMGPMRGTYVREAESSDVMLVMENIRRGINKGNNWLRAWRDKAIHIELREKMVRGLEFEGPHGRIVLEHRFSEIEAEDRWFIVEPIQGEASAERVNKTVGVLCTLKALGFAPPGTQLADVGLEPPQFTMVLHKSDGESLEFKVSKEGEKGREKVSRYLTASHEPGEIFKVASSFFYTFGVRPEKFLAGDDE